MTTNKELRDLAEKATQGPWMVASDWDRYAVMQHHSPHKRVVCSGNQNNTERWGYEQWSGCDKADADFIAAANPANILTLLDENESLQAECEKLRKDARYRFDYYTQEMDKIKARLVRANGERDNLRSQMTELELSIDKLFKEEGK